MGYNRLYASLLRHTTTVKRMVLQGFTAGLVGTATMTATTALERRLRSVDDLPVDYDATGHVVTAAATVLRHTPRTDAGSRGLFLLVHWGYGSGVATGYRLLRSRGVASPRATVTFYLVCQGMAVTLFPLVGGTPPPWRWRRDVLASSLLQHGVYAMTVAAADRRITRARA